MTANTVIRPNVTIRPNVIVKGFVGPTLLLDAINYVSGAVWYDTSGRKITRTFTFGTDFSYGSVKLVGDGSGGVLLEMGGSDAGVVFMLEHLHVGDAVSIDIGGGAQPAAITGYATAYSGPNSNASGMTGFTLSANNWTVTGTNDANVGTITFTTANYADLYNSPTDSYNVLNFTTNQYAEVTPGVYFGTNFTVEAWVKINSYASWSRVFDFGSDAGSDNVILAVTSGTSGNPVFAIEPAILTGNTTVPLELWAYLAVTYDGAIATMYLNGTSIGALAMAPPAQTSRAHCYIGKSNYTGSGDAYLEGAIGHLEIVPHAISSTNIAARYTAGRTQFPLQYSYDAVQASINSGSNSIHIDTSYSWASSVPVGATILVDGYGTYTVIVVAAPGDVGNNSGNWWYSVTPTTSNFPGGTNLTFIWTV